MESNKISQLNREDFLKKGREVLKKFGQKSEPEQLKAPPPPPPSPIQFARPPQNSSGGGCMLFVLAIVVLLSLTFNQI